MTPSNKPGVDDQAGNFGIMIEKIHESQMRIESEIDSIKEALFDPDKGLYSRVRSNTEFRSSAGRWLWILTTGVTLTIVHFVFKILIK